MPVKSKKQWRFMEMLAHNPEKARKKGSISPSKAKEFINKTKSYKKLPESK